MAARGDVRGVGRGLARLICKVVGGVAGDRGRWIVEEVVTIIDCAK